MHVFYYVYSAEYDKYFTYQIFFLFFKLKKFGACLRISFDHFNEITHS